MPNNQPELPLFGVDNAADCEAYLFVNHPIDFIPLTTDTKDEHHSVAPPATAPKSILKPRVAFSPIATPATAATAAPPMQRKASTTSESSVTSTTTDNTTTDDDTTTTQEGYLGGGALRHVAGAHHLRQLAALADLSAQAQAKRPSAAVRKPQTVDDGWHVMEWWPANVEGMEREWSEEFYE